MCNLYQCCETVQLPGEDLLKWHTVQFSIILYYSLCFCELVFIELHLDSVLSCLLSCYDFLLNQFLQSIVQQLFPILELVLWHYSCVTSAYDEAAGIPAAILYSLCCLNNAITTRKPQGLYSLMINHSSFFLFHLFEQSNLYRDLSLYDTLHT